MAQNQTASNAAGSLYMADEQLTGAAGTPVHTLISVSGQVEHEQAE
jgi:hypothetical protein